VDCRPVSKIVGVPSWGEEWEEKNYSLKMGLESKKRRKPDKL